MNIPQERLDALKSKYIDLLLSTERKGVEELVEYLETRTDFFTAPASTRYHNNFAGGLLEHSLNVYENFKIMLNAKGVEMEEDSIIISALLHDLCKCNFYVREERNRKVDGKWQTYEVWTSMKNASVPLPHSSRSIRMIRSYISLKFLEELTIFYHMGPYGGEDYEYRNLLKQVNEQNPQTLLFYIADLLASYLDEETAE
ncbi:MAG: metal-dependent phosphohydrolase [Clostridiales bacterium]|nr:MAG: metal-dependent phosphohydrolase [Clostridiales bacterium]